MKSYFRFTLIFALLVLSTACSGGGQDAGEVQIELEESEAPSIEPIIGFSPAELMPGLNELPHTFAPAGEFLIANDSLGDNWGEEVIAAIADSGRIEGFAILATLAEEEADAPVELFIVIEQFDSIDGAKVFFNYDFKPDFRNGIFEGLPFDLNGADQAITQTVPNPAKFGDGYIMYSIAFLYRNFTVHIDAPGPIDGFAQDYATQVAEIVLGHLMEAAGDTALE